MQASTRNAHRQSKSDGAARTFAELLYRFRLAAGISRLELADRVLCSENYIYRLESRDPRHRRLPTPWLVRALSEALRLTGEQGEALLRARDRLEREKADARESACDAEGIIRSAPGTPT
jgi:transcriptional regulator with XRE-family HTH domain